MKHTQCIYKIFLPILINMYTDHDWDDDGCHGNLGHGHLLSYLSPLDDGGREEQ